MDMCVLTMLCTQHYSAPAFSGAHQDATEPVARAAHWIPWNPIGNAARNTQRLGIGARASWALDDGGHMADHQPS